MKTNSKFSVKRLLFNKKFVLAFSLICAFIFWLIISIDQNPEREQTLNNLPINIGVQGTVLEESGIGVVDSSTIKTASVTVYGPNYIVSSLKDEDIRINAEISDITTPGTYTVILSAVKVGNNKDYSVVRVNPASITVKFDYIDTKEFPITAVANGASAVDGLIAETPIVNNIENSMITIKGPRTEMNKIVSVEAVADVNKALSVTTSYDAKLKLYDEAGKEIDIKPFTFSQKDIKISVPISKKKTVKFVPSFSGAGDKNITSSLKYSLDISDATIIGPPDIIDSLNTVELSSIDLTELSPSKNVFTVKPVLPDGVRVLDNIDSVNVSFDMSGYTVKTYNITRFSVQNKSADISGVSTPDVVKNVKICGPQNILNSLSSDKLVAYVDINGKKAGEHTVNISVRSETGLNLWQIGTYSISLNLK